MSFDWMKELQKKENNDELSQLVHNYYKLATMRVMQFLREKYNIPPEEIPSITLMIFGRMLNESCYSVGANIRQDYPITHLFDKKHLLNLVKVLNGESLDQTLRVDIDSDLKNGLEKFKKFILDKAPDFYTPL